MGDGIDHAAIKQAGQERRKAGVARQAIAAVGVLVERSGPVLLETLGIDQRHWNLGAIAGARPDPLGHITRRLVTLDLLHLQHLALTRVDVELIGRLGRAKAVVGVAHPRCRAFGIDVERHGIGGLVRLDEAALAALGQQPQLLVALRAFLDCQEAVKRLEVLDEYIRIGGHDIGPGGAAFPGIDVRDGHQPVVRGLPVGAKGPLSSNMVTAVQKIPLTRGQRRECHHGSRRA